MKKDSGGKKTHIHRYYSIKKDAHTQMHHSNCLPLNMLHMKVKLPLNKSSLPPTKELVCWLHEGGGGGRVVELL